MRPPMATRRTLSVATLSDMIGTLSERSQDVFEGWTVTFPEGSYNFDAFVEAGAVDNEVSSIRVTGGVDCIATVYEDSFAGEQEMCIWGAHMCGESEQRRGGLVHGMGGWGLGRRAACRPRAKPLAAPPQAPV